MQVSVGTVGGLLKVVMKPQLSNKKRGEGQFLDSVASHDGLCSMVQFSQLGTLIFRLCACQPAY
jgi:hypothetical protein